MKAAAARNRTGLLLKSDLRLSLLHLEEDQVSATTQPDTKMMQLVLRAIDVVSQISALAW